MKTLVLSEEETKKLKENNSVLVTRNDFTILVKRIKILDSYIYDMDLIVPSTIELFKE